MPPPLTQLFIDGEWRSSSSNAAFEIRNPYTHNVVGLCSSATTQDCQQAIESAGRAFRTWEVTNPTKRRDVLLRAADLLAEEGFKKEIVQSEQDEVGAPPSWGYGQWVVAPNFLRTTASLVNELKGSSFPSGSIPGAQVVSQRRAMGVILAIAPWNAPVTLVIRAIAVPILCGNTVILKSSEISPRSQAAGLPPGVLNFVSMSRDTAPVLTAEIIAHPFVRKINVSRALDPAPEGRFIYGYTKFTGSERVGRILAMEAAKHLKPCVLELGGKAPIVVLDDADIGEAARAISWGAMLFSGQVCMSSERIIVQRKVAVELVATVKEICSPLKAGDAVNDSSSKLPALFMEDSAKNVIRMMEEAIGEGAELVLGDLKREGAVLQPHLLANVKPGMRIWEQESFGPVTTFMVVDTIDEAVEMANLTEYSLSASLWTSNLNNAVAVAPRIRTGFMNVNGPSFHSEAYIGVSGLGGASGYGRFDIHNFTDERLMVTHPPGERDYNGFV